ncbi:MAG: aspartate--tRNA ligase [Actinobacteria bacterium]|nr:aspartate--tRNA ligase [Actinomycetota bacterium]
MDRRAPEGGAVVMRTRMAGELRAADAATRVELCGWIASRRDHGGIVFLDLRDASGVVQVVVDPSVAGLEAGHRVRNEWVVRVVGDVRARPEGTVNPELATGDVEVATSELEVLNEAEPPPFPVDDRVEADEVLRLRYRYVDLRRERMQRNLRLRAAVNRAIRGAMDAQGFSEVETPLLIASTPEGARDFVVPSRLQPGSFYALPQSPQLFKQLLMVGGFDRYYQIARCMRDEDLRADRQFEFTQLDAEMSFVDADDVIAVITEAVAAATEAVTGEPPAPFGRLTWHEAMERYGSDKPDTRFGMELVELGEVFAATEFRAFQTDAVKGIKVERAGSGPGDGGMSRSRLDALTDRAKGLGAAGLVWMRVGEDGALDSPVAKFLSEAEQLALVDAMGARPGDLLLLVAGERMLVNRVLGTLRLDLGRPPVTEGGLQFLWVVDFPLFEGLDDAGRPVPAHHPFTMPHADDVSLLDTATGDDLLKVRAQAYDLVLNGWELGSGSVRIHRRDVQERIFALLGISPEAAQDRFGFLLDAFRYGAPPHAGFAFGIDRLTAILAGEENIREVIAFPKTQSGLDPLTGAPTPIDPAQLKELGLAVVKPRPS